MEKDEFGFEGRGPLPPYSPPPPPPTGPAATYALPPAQYGGYAAQGAPTTQYTTPPPHHTAMVALPASNQVGSKHTDRFKNRYTNKRTAMQTNTWTQTFKHTDRLNDRYINARTHLIQMQTTHDLDVDLTLTLMSDMSLICDLDLINDL